MEVGTLVCTREDKEVHKVVGTLACTREGKVRKVVGTQVCTREGKVRKVVGIPVWEGKEVRRAVGKQVRKVLDKLLLQGNNYFCWKSSPTSRVLWHIK